MSKGSVISIVDDDASVRASMDNLLRSFGYVVHTFAAGDEFLASAKLNDTACVISDVQMSPMDGLELLANIRMRGYAMPVIFLTAFPDESIRARALAAGAACFLAKPCRATSLIASLDAALAAPGERLSERSSCVGESLEIRTDVDILFARADAAIGNAKQLAEANRNWRECPGGSGAPDVFPRHLLSEEREVLFPSGSSRRDPHGYWNSSKNRNS